MSWLRRLYFGLMDTGSRVQLSEWPFRKHSCLQTELTIITAKINTTCQFSLSAPMELYKFVLRLHDLCKELVVYSSWMLCKKHSQQLQTHAKLQKHHALLFKVQNINNEMHNSCSVCSTWHVYKYFRHVVLDCFW